MRAVGNALAEFKFHDFGAADMVMLRDGDRLTVGVDPEPGFPDGRLVSVVDTRPLASPPAGSCWSSLGELHEPLVECYDALGVDAAEGHLYILTIDRDPWNARFVAPANLYCEYFDTGPLGAGRARSIRCCTWRSAGIAGGRCGGWRWRRVRFYPFRNG
jgi:hypothetical protein